ncbi:MAG: MraY family glycosyltransferase [Chloroflexota bacterium]|nr:undecaprenyl/decaprenyl-phosphate alpha-N-acetylglucosaminyl 1-phosphate transferase [Dehalococcoidia bacterium]MDW8254202.1 MraY family glycosyltransferase [Chloroflexota bacterium]
MFASPLPATITYMAIFVVSLLLTLLGTPLARHLAIQLGLVDQPAARKIHRVPVPLMGGVAIWLGLIVALMLFTDRFNLPQLGAILLGATIVAIAGLIDDRVGLSPYLKLGVQFLATWPLLAAGVRVESATPWQEVNLILTVLWVVGVTNAFNLLDNMDGLAASVAAIASGFFLVLAAGSGQFLVASLSAAVAGASLGFLRFNFLAPAKIFMGDAGSLLLGFLLAAIGIKLRFDNDPTVTLLIPILVLGVPIFDTALVTISRLRRGRNPLTAAGRDHLSHRLTMLGLTQREAVMVIAMLSGILGLAAVFLSSAGQIEAFAIAATVVLAALYGVVQLERVYQRATMPAPPVLPAAPPPPDGARAQPLTAEREPLDNSRR